MKGYLYTENEKKIKTIKILKRNYKIIKCKVLKLNGINYIGFIDYSDRIIYLKKNKQIKETLTHEITHAIFNELGLKSKNNKRLFKQLRSNELFIESLSLLIFKNFNLK